MVAQILMNHHAFDIAHGGGNAPGGIGQMAARAHAARAELAHDPCQPLRPVAGAEGSAILGDPLDEDFFGGIGDHRIEGL